MARKEISTSWDRNNRNAINDNFIQLFDGYVNSGLDAKEALEKAIESLDLSESMQEQLNNLVVDGDSSPEAAQARVDENNVSHPTLKARLDDGFNSVDQQLAQTANKDEVNVLSSNKADKTYVDNQLNDISVSQINKNKGKFDQTYMSDELLQQITGDAPVNATPTDDSVTSEKLANKSVTFSKLSDDARKSIRSMELIRIRKGSSEDVFLKPPNNKPLSNYASEVNDIYFNNLQHSSTLPTGSVSPEGTITISPSGFYFYRFNCVEKLSVGERISFFVEQLVTSNNTKIEYRFIDSENDTLGGVISITEFMENIYGFEDLTVPVGAARFEIRLDNRGSVGDAVFYNPVLTPSAFIAPQDTRVTDLRVDMSGLKSEIEVVKGLTDKSLSIPVLTPTDFEWKEHPLKGRIFTDGSENYHTDFDVAEMKNTGGVTYYVAPDGLSSNDGLTPETPLSMPFQAKDKPDVGTIMIKGGDYYRTPQGSHPIGSIEKDLNIISYDGTSRFIHTQLLNYTKTEGYTNVYQGSRSGIGRLIDLQHKDGEDYLELTQMTSINDVDVTPNSWCTAGGIVYVHTVDGRTADENICVLLTTPGASIDSAPRNVYIEGIEFIGGARPLQLNTETGNLFAKDCKFLYGVQSNGNGLEVIGGGLVISQNCVAAKNPMDGFNYHKSTLGALPYFIEIDCIGRNNGILKGTGGSRSDNGSTAHDGVKGIRVNGKYYRNDGGNVADVNAGTETWNLGCVAFESLQGSDFLVSNGGGKMWLDGCKGFGSENSLNVAENSTTAYVRGGQFQTERVIGEKVLY